MELGKSINSFREALTYTLSLNTIGPCSVTNESKPNSTIWNPYSWNTKANLFFLDQPVGVGFSHADFGNTIATSEDAARDVQAFVTIFFESFTGFRGRAFHMSGESYAVRLLTYLQFIYQ